MKVLYHVIPACAGMTVKVMRKPSGIAESGLLASLAKTAGES